MSQKRDAQLQSKSKVNIQPFKLSRMEHLENVLHHHQRQENMESQVAKDEENDVHQSLKKMRTWKAHMQQQLEELQLKIEESEVIRKRQHHNLLESQKSFSQISLRYNTEISNKNILLSKIQQTRANFHSLQNQCQIITGSLQRMIVQRENLEGNFQEDTKKADQFEEIIRKLQVEAEHCQATYEQEMEELCSHYDNEKKAIHEQREKINSEINKQIEELQAQIKEDDIKLESIKMQLDSSCFQTEELKKVNAQFRQSLEERKKYLQGNEILLLKTKEEAEKKLHDMKHIGSEFEMIMQQKLEIQAELAIITDRCLTLKDRNKKLKETLESAQYNCRSKESNYNKTISELTESHKELNALKDVVSQELTTLTLSKENELEELRNKLNEAKNVVMSQQSLLNTLKEEETNLLHEIHQLDDKLTSGENRKSDLRSTIECLKAEIIEKKNSLDEFQQDVDSKLAAQLEENNSVKSTLMKIQTDYDDKEIETSEVMKRTTFVEEMLALHEEKKKIFEVEISELEIKYQEAQSRVQQQKIILEQRAQLMSNLRDQTEVQQKHILEEEEENKKVEKQLQEELFFLQKRYKEDQDNLNLAHQAIKSEEIKHTALKAEVDLIHSQLMEKDKIIQNLKSDLLQLKKNESEFKKSTQLSLSTTEEKRKLFEEDNKQHIAAIKELENILNEESSQLQSAVLQIKTATEKQADRMSKDQCIIDEKENLIVEMSSCITTLQTELHNANVHIKEWDVNIEQHEKEMHLLQLQLQECKFEISEQTENINEKAKRIHELDMCIKSEKNVQVNSKLEISQLIERLAILETEENKLKVEYNRQMEELGENESTSRKACEDLSNEVSALTCNLRESNSKVLQAQKILKEFTEQYKTLLLQLSTKEKTLEDVQARHALIKKRLSQSHAQMKQLQNDISRIKKFNERFCKSSTKSEKGILLKKVSETGDAKDVFKTTGTGDTKKKKGLTSEMCTPLGSSNVTPRSILVRSSKVSTPQKSSKSVSFSFDGETDTSIIIEAEDAEAIEKDPKNAHQIMARRIEIQKNQQQTTQVLRGSQDIFAPTP